MLAARTLQKIVPKERALLRAPDRRALIYTDGFGLPDLSSQIYPDSQAQNHLLQPINARSTTKTDTKSQISAYGFLIDKTEEKRRFRATPPRLLTFRPNS